MEDEQIIDLFFERSERAISETDRKYGRSCRRVSFNILRRQEDVDECLNDTYLAAWNTIPPKRPNPLVAYLLRIIKSLSLKKYRDSSAQKRNSAFDTCYEELQECLPSSVDAFDVVDDVHLKMIIQHFLDSLIKECRVMFIRRYWYGDSVKDIAKMFRITENQTSVRLYRLREKLQAHLKKEGVIL